MHDVHVLFLPSISAWQGQREKEASAKAPSVIPHSLSLYTAATCCSAEAQRWREAAVDSNLMFFPVVWTGKVGVAFAVSV